eukprot:758845-Hanusia_phi.AAC.2
MGRLTQKGEEEERLTSAGCLGAAPSKSGRPRCPLDYPLDIDTPLSLRSLRPARGSFRVGVGGWGPEALTTLPYQLPKSLHESTTTPPVLTYAIVPHPNEQSHPRHPMTLARTGIHTPTHPSQNITPFSTY